LRICSRSSSGKSVRVLWLTVVMLSVAVLVPVILGAKPKGGESLDIKIEMGKKMGRLEMLGMNSQARCWRCHCGNPKADIPRLNIAMSGDDDGEPRRT